MSKLLGHFLEEQQEPFALEVFLLERGCRRGIQKSPNCSAFLKALFGRNAIKSKGSHQDRCSSSSVTSTSTLSSDARCVQEGELQVGAERKKKDEQELSPVSVLHQTQTAESSDQDSPLHFRPLEQGEPSNSKPQWKMMKKHRFIGPSTCDQYNVNMKILHQKKQLLIDCVREVMEKERDKILGADEAWKLVCENVVIWSQESINTTLHSQEEDEWKWNADFEQRKMEISNEVENSIFEDVINEIVTF